MPRNLLATSFMGGSHCFLALSKHSRLKELLSALYKKMLVVKVEEKGNGLSLGGFPGIEVARTKEPTINP